MTHRRPRVVILVENLPVPLDRRTWQEAVALRQAGFRVTVIGPRGRDGMSALSETVEGVEVLRYPQRAASGLAGYLGEYLPSMLFTLWWFLYVRIRGRVDVIHACNPPDLFWLIGLVGRVGGARFVFDWHDPNPELSLTKFGSQGVKARSLYAVTRAFEWLSARTASRVLVTNETCERLMVERNGVPAEDVVVIRNAPRTSEHRRLGRGIEPEGRRLGYLGVMGTQDGVDLLIDAWALLKQEPNMADAELELVGDGEARPTLEARAAELGLADSVRFHGYQRATTFVPILARCRAGIVPDPPTPFNDVVTMTKVIDYMALGRGVIGFDLAETRLLGGDAVSIVTPATPRALADAMAHALREPEHWSHMGVAAAARLDSLDLDWDRYATRLVDTYRALVGAASAATGDGAVMEARA
jgi:glycosyltransferase involved in cell wall biosynthesis